MILTCPSCSTRYHLDPATLGQGGRSVRCASCGHRWQAIPPDDAPQVVALEPPGTPARPGAASPRRRVAASASLVGWLVGVLVVLVLASAIIGRNEIVAGIPASASIYQTLGLPVTVELGLQFENVTSQRLDERGVMILIIAGEIVNVSQRDRAVPPVRVTLLDQGGRELHRELFGAEAEVLPAGDKTSFSGRLVNPAEQARKFNVTFDVQS